VTNIAPFFTATAAAVGGEWLETAPVIGMLPLDEQRGPDIS